MKDDHVLSLNRPESYFTNHPGHLWHDKWTALSGTLSWGGQIARGDAAASRESAETAVAEAERGSKLLHTSITLVIVKQHMVQTGRIDGPTEYQLVELMDVLGKYTPRLGCKRGRGSESGSRRDRSAACGLWRRLRVIHCGRSTCHAISGRKDYSTRHSDG